MGHHHHHHDHTGEGRSLLLATLLNVLITVVEIIGGILSNSLALLSDAIHNLGDTLAILLAYIAGKVSKRKSNERKTFGYKRIEILAAFFNALVLIGISVFLVYEAIQRFSNPEPIKGLLMMIVAALGLLFNLAAVILLKKHSSNSLNIRSAYLHLLGDTLSSFAVIIGGILIYYFNIYWIDPLITILISIYIVRETWVVFRDSSNILMMATPEGLDIQKITDELMQIEGISNIHHVHLWGLSEDKFHFECHADLMEDLAISKTETIKKEMEDILKNSYGIGHLTVQFEFGACDDKKIIHQL
ncbi:MAG: cation diffusion facilitator family transporter [Bacteroidales bacterium]|jgi:cobalt-zinc-cadmium efflux system protein|nr:cation diffusion facilitator family transporter [Bacteroidales bacterium]